ncbi:PREDICTED: uncharacterized protein LOC106752340 isoform X3 [Dinoponera quadriceps]|uniref:Uncharacterized protein LOC106752340 isoform X3 n=1 Tax=Dinoponera quadriceps TaxID=609295 RepID=A0A6P3YHQ0_DINQU|nr:PREDICTED: uncharacterized protein LOC106752340 isoform X3 [Dinoponera quadriceps]
MSFVLQLDNVEQPAAGAVMAKKEISEMLQSAPPPIRFGSPLITCPFGRSMVGQTIAEKSYRKYDLGGIDDIVFTSHGGKSQQLLQKIEAGNNQQESTVPTVAGAFPTQVKTVLTYPVAKGAREMQSRTNTTQVLTTRVISQKLPSSTSGHHQTVPAADVTSQATAQTLANSLPSPSAGLVYPLHSAVCGTQAAQPLRGQTAAGELDHGKQQQQLTGASNVQTTLHHKLHQVKTITTGAAPVSHIQRVHLKTSSVVGQQPQTVNLHKVKTVVANQSGAVQRNPLSRLQQKPQMLSQMVNQFAANNQTNANTQTKIQQSPAAEGKVLRTNASLQQQKAQAINATSSQKVVPASQSVCNNQKVTSQVLAGAHHHPNHKIQQQQYSANQQTVSQQQGLQKLQGSQKTTVVARQQQSSSTTPLNNVSKSCGGTVVGIHKVQTLGQSLQQQTPHQKSSSQSAATLQKSQTLATVSANAVNRMQSGTNVCKSNSVPNIPKVPQNSNVITVSKQQQIASQQQPVQLQQQLLQTSQQPVVVQKPQQQSAANNLQAQKSHSITNVHQKVITTMPNNQRSQTAMSLKLQQQQSQQTLMRIGISAKGQTLQSSQSAGTLKTTSQKVVNPMKAANSQNTVQQQPAQKNSSNIPSMKSTQQQQQQNIIGSQNAQKQPGCIKTIPPQKPVQRNHAQKVGGGGGIKTSLNTNVCALKGPATSTIAQKASIKTLLPQQTVASNIMAHKSSPIKVQQQVIQQKQLVTTLQYPISHQVRQQAGQLKTLLPVMTSETRKGPQDMDEIEFRASKEEEQSIPKSPVRRMPPPYECLQFVLQDHNYGAPPPRTPPPPSPPPHPKQQPINGAGSSAATSQHPYIFCPVVSSVNVEDDVASIISSEAGREAELEGEETETANEGEGDDEDSVTRCICDFEHDDGYMICCDRCLVWQHVDCMGIDRSNIPDEYLCEMCRPRRVDRQRARALQMRKREELLNSDMSSDTSSTSSADTDVGVNATTQKKRSLPQQQSVPRQRSKSDAPPAQRRDSHPRQSSAVRKKEAAAKRGPGKRKAKRRMSLEDKEEDAQDGWGTSNMAPLRQWIERYEEAVTNHYSPELRARISSIKVNGTHSDLRQSNMNVVATGKCRLNVHSNNVRFLVATMYLPPNTPVVELRGKYMLSTQHRPQHPQGRQHAQRPGPFVFFYRLPRDGTEVCVDTRTYGNDARFVRRSCKPNAEVKHCIEKGTLHLYIVTTTPIEKNAEITIKHEQHDLLLSPNPNSSALPVVCACNNPRECQIATASQLNRRGSNGALVENADGRERRRRGRRNTVCEDAEAAPAVPSTSVAQTTPTVSAVPTVSAPPPKRTVTAGVAAAATRQLPKEEPASTATVQQQPQTSPGIGQSAPPETKKDKKKMTREERKMEAIMKAFERMEKAEQRKQEVLARNAQRKESSGTHSDNEDNHSTTGQQSKSKQASSSERPLRRKRRKGRARTTSTSQQPQSSRRTRLNSAESDVSSGDESNSMQSPPLLGQTRPPSRDAPPYSSHLHTPAKSTADAGTGPSSGHHQGIPTAAGLLLALANSNAPPGPPSSPPPLLQQPTPVKSPTCDSGASSSSQSSTPSTPLSSACLLVAAAVGPLAPGLKFPKTKKALMNEWLKESPDLPPPQANVIPQVSPLSALPNSMNTALCIRQPDFPLNPTTTAAADPSAEFLSQSYAAKSLATLVQAANSVSGICDSPPQQQQRRQQQQTVSNFNNVNSSNGGCPVSTGSAKKRWLRQAISEECDSPNSRPESPPPLLETVAPPKKRRIARESLSSDNYTPPTTPTMLLPETAPNSRSLCPTEDEYMEHAQSPVVEQIDEKHYEPVSAKEEVNVEPDEKLSIDIPRSGFYIKREEKTGIPDVVKTEVSPEVIKTENVVAIKEEVSPKCEVDEVKADYDLATALHPDTKVFAKNDLEASVKNEVAVDLKVENPQLKRSSPVKEETQTSVAKGTVEIIDQNEPDTEMEEFSSPPWYRCTMEPDTILKQRVAEMRLEFGGGIAEIVNIEHEKPDYDDERKPSEEEEAAGKQCREVDDKSDDNTSIDEFDVEAQMKKITGDDGNDYQEKIETGSERDKSMDGIEGLMESSKEDSDSEDKDIDDEIKYCEPAFKLFNVGHEDETPTKEPDAKEVVVVPAAGDEARETDTSSSREPVRTDHQPATFAASPEESSVFEPASSNVDAESPRVVDHPPKIFHSIPPLSERIRKKTTDAIVTSKTPSLDFEAAIIESTINMDTTEEESKNGEQKSIALSTALRELLEAKLDDQPAGMAKDDEKTAEKNSQREATNTLPTVQMMKLNSPERASQDPTPARTPETRLEEAPAKAEEEAKPKEIKRLKDPRTVVPNNMPAPPAFKSDALPPVKRKVRTLSISEYRKRKQQSSGGSLAEPEPSNDTSAADKNAARDRSDSASSGTSSLSSDEEGCKMSHSLDLQGLTALQIFTCAEGDEKKGGEEGAIGWSAAPTLVERQRENLTERLKREFGLFLSDDEEERARKHGLTADAILKARKVSPPPHSSVSSTPPTYPLPTSQLPPQPYIPPPGSAPIHYPPFQSKPVPVLYSGFPLPQITTAQQPVYGGGVVMSQAATGANNSKQQQQPFLMPQTSSQAPPGSNPYPPHLTMPAIKFTSATPASAAPPPTTANQAAAAYPPMQPPGQPQKPFFTHPAPRS